MIGTLGTGGARGPAGATGATGATGPAGADAPVDPGRNGFRITLESGNPVPSADQLAKSTIYLTPYRGNVIALYNAHPSAQAWRYYSADEKSIAINYYGTISANTNVDIFAFIPDDEDPEPPDFHLDLIPWPSNNVRGVPISPLDGVWTATTAPNFRYLGTVRTSGTNAIDDSEAKGFVWSVDNQVLRRGRKRDATDEWTCTNVNFEAMNGGAAAWKFEFIIGIQRNPVRARAHCSGKSATAGQFSEIAIGLDSTTEKATDSLLSATGDTNYGALDARYIGIPTIGYHYLQGIQRVSIGTATFADKGRFHASFEIERYG